MAISGEGALEIKKAPNYMIFEELSGMARAETLMSCQRLRTPRFFKVPARLTAAVAV